MDGIGGAPAGCIDPLTLVQPTREVWEVLANQPWRCLSAAAPPLFKKHAPLSMLARCPAVASCGGVFQGSWLPGPRNRA